MASRVKNSRSRAARLLIDGTDPDEVVVLQKEVRCIFYETNFTSGRLARWLNRISCNGYKVGNFVKVDLDMNEVCTSGDVVYISLFLSTFLVVVDVR